MEQIQLRLFLVMFQAPNNRFREILLAHVREDFSLEDGSAIEFDSAAYRRITAYSRVICLYGGGQLVPR